MNNRPGLILALVGAALSLIAIAQLPYGYYTFNRVALTVLAIILAVVAVRNKAPGWLWGLAPIAVLWNPAIPFYLTREIWTPLNVIAAAVFIVCGVLLKRAKSPEEVPTDASKDRVR